MQVKLTGPLRSAVGGLAVVESNAQTIRELFLQLSKQHPEFAVAVKVGVAVAINGEIYRDVWSTAIPADAEVVLLPRIQGG